ncbi:hypothetical protein DL96DRAFT_1589040 [Flagelloscypha sp. PMI_526]|nr:hypothetical protein DL96DRAFT_1589040 [Flagelloscypha sp. PMI_526]
MPDLSTNNSSSSSFSSPSSFVFKSSRYKVVSPQYGSQSRKPELSFAQLEAHRKDASSIKKENTNGFSVRLPPVPPAIPQADAPAREEQHSQPIYSQIPFPPLPLPNLPMLHPGAYTFPAPIPSQRSPEGPANHQTFGSISQKSKKTVIEESMSTGRKRSHSHEHVVQDTQSTLFGVNKKLEAHALIQSGAPDDKLLAKAPLSTSSIHPPKGVGPA